MKHICLTFTLSVLALACGPSETDVSLTEEEAPANISEAVSPDVAGGAHGGGVAWVERSGDTRRLLVLPDGAAESVEVARGAIGFNGQTGPRLAVGPSGEFFIAFVEERRVKGRRFPASVLKLARSSDGGRTWAAPVTVHPDPGFATSHSFHSLAVGPEGAVYVSWLDGTARDRYRKSHAIEEPSAEEPSAEGSHVHHRETDEPGVDLAVARSADGGRTFDPPVIVATGTCECCRTALAVNDEALYVAWRHIFPGIERDIALARSTDGGRSWTQPTRVYDDGWAIDGCPHAGPAVVAGPKGDLTVAWPTGVDGRAGSWRVSSSDGGRTFGAAEPLQTVPPFGQVAAARDDTGRLWLAWENPHRGEILVHHPERADTVRVSGSGPVLAGTATGWRLAWEAEGGVTVKEGS